MSLLDLLRVGLSVAQLLHEGASLHERVLRKTVRKY
jgi:hypothetical protein